MSSRSPPVKKEKLDKTPVKTEKKTPEASKQKALVAKKSPKKGKSAKKTKKKSPPKAKLSPSKVKSEISPNTSMDQDKASVADEEIKTKSSPSPAKKTPPPINSFFLTTKQAKEQSAGGSGPTGSEYSPAKTNYHPIKDTFWKYGEK